MYEYQIVLKGGRAFSGNALGELESLSIKSVPDPLSMPWNRNIIKELAVNPGPYNHPSLDADGGWWKRRLDQITGLTIHHTLSDSPHATAKHYITKEGGRPSIPYTIWITQTGEVLLCVDLTEGLWHNHDGHRNTSLSVGLAGTLHLYEPAEPQLQALVKVCVWALTEDTLPSITSTRQIKGHMDYLKTECPGWIFIKTGKDHWKRRFQVALAEALR